MTINLGRAKRHAGRGGAADRAEAALKRRNSRIPSVDRMVADIDAILADDAVTPFRYTSTALPSRSVTASSSASSGTWPAKAPAATIDAWQSCTWLRVTGAKPNECTGS